MFNVLKVVGKHIFVWFMIMCMMFFTAAPIARTDVRKWMVVAVIALFISEAAISIVEHGKDVNGEVLQ